MKYFLPLFLLFVLSSCSVQKRLYNKGFYVSNSRTTNKTDIKDTTKQVTLLHTIKQVKKETNVPLLATAVKAIEIINKKQTLLIDPCDTIVMKTGERVLGKVTKVREDLVFFENCDAQSYSSSSLHKRDVSHIIYAIHDNQLENNKKKRQHLIAKLIAFFLLLLSVVLYAIGFNQIGALMLLLGMLASLLLIISLIMLLAIALSKNRE